MSESDRFPSYVECVAATLSNSPAPMSVSSIVAAVESLRPVGSGARSAIYRAISKLYQAVSVEPGRYGWLSKLMEGATFRHPLSADEARRGYLMLDELEHAVFCPDFFQTQRPAERTLTVSLFGGETVVARTHVERRTWSIYLGKPFVEWIHQQGGQGRDDLIIYVEDATAGRYNLRLQPREAKDTDAIRDRNIQLGLIAEDIAEDDRRVRAYLPTWELVARLIARAYFHHPVPPDDLHYVLEQFSTLHFIEEKGYSLDPPLVSRSEAPLAAARRHPEEARTSRYDREAESGYADEFEGHWFEMNNSDDDAYDNFEHEDLEAQFGDNCGAYELYLEQFQEAGGEGPSLAHHEFHLLEAELEYLVALEVEFGGLLPEQKSRKDELANRLFIDPDSWPNDDFDIPDYPDYEDPPYWEN